eukprot:1158198-Pelagomonas_calceolata.AAC.5
MSRGGWQRLAAEFGGQLRGSGLTAWRVELREMCPGHGHEAGAGPAGAADDGCKAGDGDAAIGAPDWGRAQVLHEAHRAVGAHLVLAAGDKQPAHVFLHA